MRAFMTGATGYIGNAVARRLRRGGHDVIGLARNDSASEKLQRDGVHPVMGDMQKLEVLEEMVRDADAVIHCGFAAGPHAPGLEAAALDAMLDAIGSDHEAFIYTSGIWVYGSRGDAVVDESAPLNPTPLVAWRPSHERRVLGAAAHHLRTIVIRPGMVYGDDGGMIGGMLDEARRGVLRVVGDGRNRWSTVRVDALAELYVLAVERAERGAVYNAARGAAVPYVEIARAASRAAGGDGTIEHIDIDAARAAMGPFADALAVDLQVSSERATRELGWEPHRPTVLEELSATTVV
ncbi:MAG: NAD-dependent epimerase/dehydratase family protein [Candidatus Velthaea sp.]